MEVSAEVRVKAGEKYKTEILPHLQQLAGKLQTMMESKGQRVNFTKFNRTDTNTESRQLVSFI